MATLTELYTEIDNHSLTVERIVGEDYGSYLFVRVIYIADQAENEAREISVVIHIKDRGGAEEAFYRPKPEYLKSTNFKDTLTIAIETFKLANVQLEEYEFLSVNEVDKFAIIKVYWENAGSTDIRYYFLWEDGASAIQFRQLTNYGT